MKSVTFMFRLLSTSSFCLLYFTIILLHSPSDAAVYTVTTTDDCTTSALPADLCLREAIILANDTAEADVIHLPAGIYILSLSGSSENGAVSGDLDILESLAIIGENPTTTIIDANNIDRVFHIPNFFPAAPEVVFENITIKNGLTDSTIGSESGAGILNTHDLILRNVIIQNNQVIGSESSSIGGGIANQGNLEIYDSTIANNSARRGGGIFNAGNANLRLVRSLISENTAAQGGGLTAYGTFDLQNSTIAGNTASLNYAGGIYVDGAAIGNIAFCTISGNWSPSPFSAGIRSASSSLNVRYSIFSENRYISTNDLNNCFFFTAPTNATYNLEDSNSCGFSLQTNFINTNPLLGPLADNGGKTFTFALLKESPAIDAVPVNTGVTKDQRGKARPQGKYADIGAFEFGSLLCFPVKGANGNVTVICM